MYISLWRHLIIKSFFGWCNGGVTEQKAEFFHTLLVCSKADFRSANLTSEVIFFNEILRVAISTNACELTE